MYILDLYFHRLQLPGFIKFIKLQNDEDFYWFSLISDPKRSAL